MPTPEPEVLYFGCLRSVGHYLHSKTRSLRYEQTAWGNELDTGCFPKASKLGVLYTARKPGWTAIAVWDNSVDPRGGSHSTFVVEAEMSTEELLSLARKQWPEVFGRRGFPSFTIAIA